MYKRSYTRPTVNDTYYGVRFMCEKQTFLRKRAKRSVSALCKSVRKVVYASVS
jgi:hypothetical protein